MRAQFSRISNILPVGLRQGSSSAAFCHIKDVCCETNLQQLWRQVFRSCRSEAVEQPSKFRLNCDKLTLAFNDLNGC